MTRPDTDWRDRSACEGAPIEFFFGDPDPYKRDVTAALLAEGRRRYCDRCPVREECLDAALNGGRDVYGMWGGTTQAEREKLKRRILRVKCPVCFGPNLRADGVLQVCLDCGQSWTTVRLTAQARLDTDVAA